MNLIPGLDIFLNRSELSSPAKSLLLMIVIAVVAIAMWLGLAIVAQLIVRRRIFRARWGERAFSIAFRWCAIPGLTFVAMGIAHFVWIEGARAGIFQFQSAHVADVVAILGHGQMTGRFARCKINGLPTPADAYDARLWMTPSCFSRVVKEAVHELGHCGDRRCVMAFSNSLADTDYKRPEFCLKCKGQMRLRGRGEVSHETEN